MSDKQTILPSTVKDFLRQQREDFSSMLTALMNSFNERYDKLLSTVSDIKSSLQYSQKDIESLKKSVEAQDVAQKSFADEVMIIKEDLKEIHNNIDYLENQSRRNNLVFGGIEERGKESWAESEEKVLNILKDKMDIQNVIIERAHRVGKPKPQKSRPIVAKFLNYKDREAVLYNARNLRGTSLYVREDLSDRVLEKRRAQIHLLKEARVKGKIAFFNYDRLVIKDRQIVDSQHANAADASMVAQSDQPRRSARTSQKT